MLRSRLACFIKPKSQIGISYPPNLVHILILIGFAKEIKFLAVSEVTANLTSCLVEKYKGSKKLIKGNFFRHTFCFLPILKNNKTKPFTGFDCWHPEGRLDTKIGPIGWCHILMSYAHMTSNDAYDIKWRIWHKYMMLAVQADVGV